MVFFVLFFYYLMMVSALVSIRIKSVWQSSGGRAIFTSYAILAAPAVGTATGESFFCVFVFLALFIDLVTDKVQPLSRNLPLGDVGILRLRVLDGHCVVGRDGVHLQHPHGPVLDQSFCGLDHDLFGVGLLPHERL